MTPAVFGPAAAVTILNRAFNDISQSNLVFNNQVARDTAIGDAAFANEFGNGFKSLSNSALSTLVLTNMGLMPNPDLQVALTDYFAANSTQRGLVVLQLGQILSTLEGATGALSIFAAPAAAWNAEVTAGYTYMATVTNTVPSSSGENVTVGQTFTLTKIVQSTVGTSGNDTIIAGDEGGSATLNAGDQISGGAGTDILKLFNAAGALNAANFALATITGVENVEATLSASTQTLNVSGNVDVAMVSLVNGFDGVVTLKKAQTAGLNGTIDTTGAATSFAFSDVTGGADTANLVLTNAVLLNSVGAGNGVTIAGVETLNIAATGTNVLGAATLAATTKIVITGAGSLNTTLASTLAKTIDGSAATGNLTINNSAAATAVQSIKTGTGNDTYTTVYADLTADDLIDMGAGTDSLRFSDNATFNNTATKALLTKVTGVEQLGTVNKTLTIDGDFVTQTSYYTDGPAGNLVLTNVANSADVNFGKTDVVANPTGVNTVGMKLGANILNVNLAGSASGASVVQGVIATAGDGLTVTGSATINVKSTGTDGQPNNVLDLTAADNQSVVITGSQNLTLTGKAAIATTGFSIDGSAFTGKLTVTGTAASDIVKGGSGNDIISGGAGAAVSDTLTGGAGNDKFVVTGLTGITAVTADVITDFTTGADSISFGAAGSSTNFTKGAVAVADFTAALAAANAVLTSTVAPQYNAQQVGADTWLFYNDGVATGADQVVKLTGVVLAGIVFSDIVA